MKKYLSIVLALIMTIGGFFGAMEVDAADLEEIVIAGLYQNPNTGIIEDSGGESSYALGQSMVENMMSTVALVEENPEGGYYLTFDLNLYEFISDIEFQLQNEGETNYADVVYEIVEEQEDTVTVKVPVDNMDSLLRASCYVIPMGRSVVFYIIYSDTFEEGMNNTTGPTEDLATDETTSDSNNSDSNTSLDNEVLGLTLSPGLSGSEESLSSENGQDIDFIIDGSFWILLFVLIFCTNLITGSILIVGYHLIKTKVLINRNEMEEEYEDEDLLEVDMLDVHSYGFEVDDEEDN